MRWSPKIDAPASPERTPTAALDDPIHGLELAELRAHATSLSTVQTLSAELDQTVPDRVFLLLVYRSPRMAA